VFERRVEPMATEVKHGEHPRFRVKIVPKSTYGLTLIGYYTKKDGWTAGGVRKGYFHSQQRKGLKRRAELLGMRTIFVHWYMTQWLKTGGEWWEGVYEIRHYPWKKLRKRLDKRPPVSLMSQAVRWLHVRYVLWRMWRRDQSLHQAASRR